MSRLDFRVTRRTVKGVEYLQPQVGCPECRRWVDVRDDQLGGSVEIVCPECGWRGFADGRPI